MAKQEDVFKKVVSHAKEYGFIFPVPKFMTDFRRFTITDKTAQNLKITSNNTGGKQWFNLTRSIVGLDAAI